MSAPDEATNGETVQQTNEGPAKSGSPNEQDGKTERVGGFHIWEEGGEEFVTIRKGGDIAPNSTVVDHYFDGCEGIIMGYNPEEELIGLRPVDDYDEDNDRHYRLNGNDNGGMSIHAGAFLRVHDLSHEKTLRYEPEWREEIEMLVVDPTEDGREINRSES